MKRLYRIINSEQMTGRKMEAYVVQLDADSVGIVDENDSLLTFKHAKLENLLKFEELTMENLEPVQE